MSERKYYVICDDDCRFESMTAEQILTAIQEAVTEGAIGDPNDAVISKLKELRTGGAVQIWTGTEAEFNALSPTPTIGKSVVRIGTNGVLYLCTDDSSLGGVPTHASTHEIGGTDAITPDGIGAAPAQHASQHATGAADEITPSSIGAFPAAKIMWGTALPDTVTDGALFFLYE